METNNINQNTEQQPTITTPTPEASGEQGSERVFTQDDVNRIVSERLARERQKTEPTAIDERETQLKARESRLECRDYLEEVSKGEFVKPSVTKLLDVLDTAETEKFKETVGKLLEIGAFERNPQLEPLKISPVDRRVSEKFDAIAAAFKPKSI